MAEFKQPPLTDKQWASHPCNGCSSTCSGNTLKEHVAIIMIADLVSQLGVTSLPRPKPRPKLHLSISGTLKGQEFHREADSSSFMLVMGDPVVSSIPYGNPDEVVMCAYIAMLAACDMCGLTFEEMIKLFQGAHSKVSTDCQVINITPGALKNDGEPV
jgi:hypothetical protein